MSLRVVITQQAEHEMQADFTWWADHRSKREPKKKVQSVYGSVSSQQRDQRSNRVRRVVGMEVYAVKRSCTRTIVVPVRPTRGLPLVGVVNAKKPGQAC